MGVKSTVEQIKAKMIPTLEVPLFFVFGLEKIFLGAPMLYTHNLLVFLQFAIRFLISEGLYFVLSYHL